MLLVNQRTQTVDKIDFHAAIASPYGNIDGLLPQRWVFLEVRGKYSIYPQCQSILNISFSIFKPQQTFIQSAMCHSVQFRSSSLQHVFSYIVFHGLIYFFIDIFRNCSTSGILEYNWVKERSQTWGCTKKKRLKSFWK